MVPPINLPKRNTNTTANTSFIAFGVVPSLISSTTSPRSSNTQYQLEPSPRSKPMVTFGWQKFLLYCAVEGLLFFIVVPLLSLLPPPHSLQHHSIPPDPPH